MTVKAPPYKQTTVLFGNINFLIKHYRKLKNLSQNEFAEMINFSREHLACIETGKEFISLRKLFLIADTLGVSLKQLIDFD